MRMYVIFCHYHIIHRFDDIRQACYYTKNSFNGNVPLAITVVALWESVYLVVGSICTRRN